MKVLEYEEVDHNYYQSENSSYAIANNNTLYLPKELRKKTWSVVSANSGKKLFEGSTRKSCVDFIEKRTNKKVKFLKQ